jgi:hypothetical protein
VEVQMQQPNEDAEVKPDGDAAGVASLVDVVERQP